jgi:thymidylate synthase (FAD)
VWITPNAAQVISDCARVSNPANQGKDGTKLIQYLIENKHWSPLEMASACFEIETTRDIARQILRHRSFSFQEFSQRYAEVPQEFIYREARLQDVKNRQNSITNTDEELQNWFDYQMHSIQSSARQVYEEALKRGIAKEQARCVLPEGLTMSRMYMTGNIRSWKHYVDLRSGNGTQKEHQLIAQAIGEQLKEQLPNLF